jgi:hypothetical protein
VIPVIRAVFINRRFVDKNKVNNSGKNYTALNEVAKFVKKLVICKKLAKNNAPKM